MTLVIFPSCSASLLPRKIGCPMSSSAKMHPTLHMSTSVPYTSAPSSSSGGLQSGGMVNE